MSGKKGKNKKEEIGKKERALLDFIGKFESKGGDYDILYGGYKGDAPDKPITEMTLNEIYKFQKAMVKDQIDKGADKGSSAIGAHQFVRKTLEEEARLMGLTGEEVFTPELQDSIMMHRLKRYRGFDDFLKGDISEKQFAKKLSQEFASIPDPETNETFYKDGLNKSLVDTDTVLSELSKIKNLQEEPRSSIDENLILNSTLDETKKQELVNTNNTVGFTKNEMDLVSSQLGDLSPINLLPSFQEEPNDVKMAKDANLAPINLIENSNKVVSNQFNDGGLLTMFNSGGTHEENSLGGIPQGRNQKGGFNLVEEGETRYDDYIFSNSLYLDKKTADELRLDPKYINKSFADISKEINKEIEDRPFDKIAIKTAKDKFNTLMYANENMKNKSSNKKEDNKMFLGGAIGAISGVASLLGGGDKETGGGIMDKLGGITNVAGAAGNLLTTFTNEDTTLGEKALSLIPGVGSPIASLLSNKRKEQAMQKEQDLSANNPNRSNFNLGGMLGALGHVLRTNNPIEDESEVLNSGLGLLSGASDPMSSKEEKEPFKLNEKMLRYAPVVGNAIRYLDAPDAEVESYGRLNDRYVENKFDENSFLNRINDAASSNRRSLLEASGGNTGATRASLLGNHINTLKATSEGFMAGKLQNAKENQFGQTFNKDTNVRNQNIAQNESIANTQNKAAASMYKDSLLNSTLTDLGEIGKEKMFNDIMVNTTGYNKLGDKEKNPYNTPGFNPYGYKKGGFLEKLSNATRYKESEIEKILRMKYGNN